MGACHDPLPILLPSASYRVDGHVSLWERDSSSGVATAHPSLLCASGKMLCWVATKTQGAVLCPGAGVTGQMSLLSRGMESLPLLLGLA